jgi:hypothetical protein
MASCELMKEASLHQGRATIDEIRMALGGDCEWVTRRLLKRKGKQFPAREDIARWHQEPPSWFLLEKQKRSSTKAKNQAGKVAIACPGCGFSIEVKPTTARRRKDWEGLYCGRGACDYEPPGSAGMVTVIGHNAVGSFTGWRHEFPSDEQIASLTKARDLAAAALAIQPGSPVRATIANLVAPAGTGNHLVTFSNGWSTGVTIGKDGSVEIENPMVIAGLHRMVHDGDELGITVRTFTHAISHTAPNGTKIPVKELRCWYLVDGAFHPFTEEQTFEAHCIDHETGEPVPPEQGVRYLDAYPVDN